MLTWWPLNLPRCKTSRSGKRKTDKSMSEVTKQDELRAGCEVWGEKNEVVYSVTRRDRCRQHQGRVWINTVILGTCTGTGTCTCLGKQIQKVQNTCNVWMLLRMTCPDRSWSSGTNYDTCRDPGRRHGTISWKRSFLCTIYIFTCSHHPRVVMNMVSYLVGLATS